MEERGGGGRILAGGAAGELAELAECSRRRDCAGSMPHPYVVLYFLNTLRGWSIGFDEGLGPENAVTSPALNIFGNAK